MIPFVKAHACGNDFLLVDEIHSTGGREQLARRLCNRNTGIGADGVEWVRRCEDGAAVVLSNADGSTAEISGNGTRCVAAWLAAESGGYAIKIQTAAGVRVCRILAVKDNIYSVETSMGVPKVAPLTVGKFAGISVSMGNPHFVLFVSEFPEEWIAIGEELSTHAAFASGSNVEFAKILGTDAVEFRIYERGAGPTLSSGTGSCAVAVAAMEAHGMQRNLRVLSLGGEQTVRWQDEVYLTGPAELVARGEAWA